MNDTRNIFAAIRYVCARNASGANLTGANLGGADLYDADLYAAYLRGANLRGADLTRANLSGANLSGADLYGANLIRANLTSADLYAAYLRGANLTDANLTDANILNTRGLVSVSGVGRSNRLAYAYWTGDAIAYQVGCRDADEADARAAIDNDYADDDLERAAYHAAIDYLKIAFEAFMKRHGVGRYDQARDEVAE